MNEAEKEKKRHIVEWEEGLGTDVAVDQGGNVLKKVGEAAWQVMENKDV